MSDSIPGFPQFDDVADAVSVDGERPRFVIDDEGKATWALNKISMARAELKRREEAAEAWVSEARRRVKEVEDRFLDELRAWGQNNRPKGKQTITLLTGQLKFRAVPPRYVVVDKESVIGWAEGQVEGAVRREPDLLTRPVQEWLEQNAIVNLVPNPNDPNLPSRPAIFNRHTGEEILGVVWQEAGESFKVE